MTKKNSEVSVSNSFAEKGLKNYIVVALMLAFISWQLSTKEDIQPR